MLLLFCFFVFNRKEEGNGFHGLEYGAMAVLIVVSRRLLPPLVVVAFLGRSTTGDGDVPGDGTIAISMSLGLEDARIALNGNPRIGDARGDRSQAARRSRCDSARTAVMSPPARPATRERSDSARAYCSNEVPAAIGCWPPEPTPAAAAAIWKSIENRKVTSVRQSSRIVTSAAAQTTEILRGKSSWNLLATKSAAAKILLAVLGHRRIFPGDAETALSISSRASAITSSVHGHLATILSTLSNTDGAHTHPFSASSSNSSSSCLPSLEILEAQSTILAVVVEMCALWGHFVVAVIAGVGVVVVVVGIIDLGQRPRIAAIIARIGVSVECGELETSSQMSWICSSVIPPSPSLLGFPFASCQENLFFLFSRSAGGNNKQTNKQTRFDFH